MKKSRGIISLILVAAVIAALGFITVCGLDGKGMGAAKNINLGLDLEGGVSITYQAKGDTPSAEDMKDTVYKMQRRVEQYSTEAQAYQEYRTQTRSWRNWGSRVLCTLSGRTAVTVQKITL